MSTRLRAVHRSEVARLRRWDRETTSEFEDFGGPSPTGLTAADRLPLPPGSGTLAVVDGDDVLLGSVGWHLVGYGPNAGSQALDIGISLHPSHWGRGHGSRAQRMLAAHLFATTAPGSSAKACCAARSGGRAPSTTCSPTPGCAPTPERVRGRRRGRDAR